MSALISRGDVEAISAYLDGQLGQRDRARLEARLKADPTLQAALEEMRRTRAVLRAAPVLRAPRNFSLKPGMVPMKSRVPQPYPVLRLASVLASLLFLISFVGDLIYVPAPVLAPMAVGEVTQATQAALMQSSAPEGAAEKLAAGAEPAADLTATAVSTPGPEILMASPAEPEASRSVAPEPGPVLRASAGVTAEGRRGGETADQAAQAGPAERNLLRVAEVTFLAIAVLTGMAALYLRRRAAG